MEQTAPRSHRAVNEGLGTMRKPGQSEPRPILGHQDWFQDKLKTQTGPVRVNPVTLKELSGRRSLGGPGTRERTPSPSCQRRSLNPRAHIISLATQFPEVRPATWWLLCCSGTGCTPPTPPASQDAQLLLLAGWCGLFQDPPQADT